MTAHIKNQLIRDGTTPPEDKKLRRLVRMMLRNHRRGLTLINLPDLSEGKPQALFLATVFVKKQLANEKFNSV